MKHNERISILSIAYFALSLSFAMGTILAWTSPTIDTMAGSVKLDETEVLKPPSNLVVFEAGGAEVSIYGSLLNIGALIGCIFCVFYSSDKLRPIHALLLSAIILIISNFFTSTIYAMPKGGINNNDYGIMFNHVYYLYFMRICSGFAIGIISSNVPMVLDDLVCRVWPEHRDLILLLHQVSIVSGMFYITYSGNFLFVSFNVFSSWRVLSLHLSLFPISSLIAFCIAWFQYRPNLYVQREKSSLEPMANVDIKWQKSPQFLFLLFLLSAQQLTGINILVFYLNSILSSANIPVNLFKITSSQILFYQVILTIVSSLWISPKIGLKKSLYIAIVVCILSNIFLSLGFLLNLPRIISISIYGFFTAFALGLGGVPWSLVGKMCGRVLPVKCAPVITCANWIFSFFVTFFASYLINVYGVSYVTVFLTFAIFCGLTLGVVYRWYDALVIE